MRVPKLASSCHSPVILVTLTRSSSLDLLCSTIRCQGPELHLCCFFAFPGLSPLPMEKLGLHLSPPPPPTPYSSIPPLLPVTSWPALCQSHSK